MDDELIIVHPCHRVSADPVPEKPRRIVTGAQFDVLYKALPCADAQLLVETAIESGLRWGELTELRVRDLDFRSRIVTVSRAVVEVPKELNPAGGRFHVKEYPKDEQYRRFKLSEQIVRKLKAHVAAEDLRQGDLFFARRGACSPRPRSKAPQSENLGMTEPNEAGRQYRHGSLTAYNAAKCRCQHCKNAYAVYRATRRANGKDNPRTPRTSDIDEHVPNNWFRDRWWNPARKSADLGFTVRIHNLRHAHASWVLAGCASLQVVKERLGHARISTTEKYLHTLDDADETALDAFDKIRNRRSA
jgi:integrase